MLITVLSNSSPASRGRQRKAQMSECTKDECEYQDENGHCTLMECIYYIDPETLGDMKYHRLKDDGKMK